MSELRFHILLALILGLALALRLQNLEADAPSGACADLSLSVDGSWYTAAALDRMVGRPGEPLAPYDRPLYTAYLRGVFEVFGASLRSTHLASVPAGIAAILFTALLGRALYGSGAGLLAGLFLASSYPFFVFNRSGLIYTFLTALAALALFLAARGSKERRPWLAALAWGVTLAGIFLAKEILILLLPALCAAWPASAAFRRRERLPLLLLGLGAAALAAAACLAGLPAKLAQKLTDYFQAAGLLETLGRILDFERRSGFFASGPLLGILALGGALRRRSSPEERMLACYLAGGLLVFAPFAYTPLRYLLILFPAACVLAAGALAKVFAGAEEPARAPERLWAALLKGALLFYFVLQLCLYLLPAGSAARLVAAAALFALILIVPGALAGPRLAGARRALGAAALLLIVAPQLFRTAEACAEPRHTALDATRELEAILSPPAVLSGLFAHLLTTENLIGRNHLEAVRFGNGALRDAFLGQGITHLTLEATEGTSRLPAIFAADGAALELVHTFDIRGLAVNLYRFEWAEQFYPLSDYEKGVREMARGDAAAALPHFRAALERHPRSAAVRAALSKALEAWLPPAGEALHPGPRP